MFRTVMFVAVFILAIFCAVQLVTAIVAGIAWKFALYLILTAVNIHTLYNVANHWN